MPKPKITWEGFGRLGPPREAYEIVNLGLSKMAIRIFVRCHVRNNYADEYEYGFITCMYLETVKKVVMCIRGVTIFMGMKYVKPLYRSMLLRYGRISIPSD